MSPPFDQTQGLSHPPFYDSIPLLRPRIPGRGGGEWRTSSRGDLVGASLLYLLQSLVALPLRAVLGFPKESISFKHMKGDYHSSGTGFVFQYLWKKQVHLSSESFPRNLSPCWVRSLIHNLHPSHLVGSREELVCFVFQHWRNRFLLKLHTINCIKSFQQGFHGYVKRKSYSNCFK